MESLTDEIEAGATEYMSKIRDLGGVLKAIEIGFIQKEIQESAYRYQRSLEAGDQVLVGVNRFQQTVDSPIEILRIDPSIEVAQIARLQEQRKTRSEDKVEQALDAVRSGAEGTQNLMPTVLGAVKAGATIGEISDAMRDVFGEFREAVFV